MWKIAVGFVIFAGLALFILSKGGDIDMGGEKHGAEATHAPAEAPAKPAIEVEEAQMQARRCRDAHGLHARVAAQAPAFPDRQLPR
mgnify:CR=1 FL=1